MKQIYQFYRLLKTSVKFTEGTRTVRHGRNTGSTNAEETCCHQDRARLSRMEFRKTATRTHRITVYTISNPEKIEKDLGRDRIEKKDNHHHIKGFQVRNKEDRRSICVYCSAESHRSIERDKNNSGKSLCYNCTGSNHPASICRSCNRARCNLSPGGRERITLHAI